MKLCFLIRSLNVGGAERQLTELAEGLSERGHLVTVITFYSGGYFEQKLNEQHKIRCKCLNKNGRWDIISFLYRLIQTIRAEQPDVLHSYLAVSNILSIFLRLFMENGSVVWGVRASNLDLSRYPWFPRLAIRVECVLSRFADLIIVNSYAGLDYHIQRGFPSQKLVVVLNGINIEVFRPDLAARKKTRAGLGISNNQVVIGMVGRLVPMKDHPTFLKAAALLAIERKDVQFVCVGEIPSDSYHDLVQLCDVPELKGRFRWVGPWSDMPAIYNAFDLLVSSSLSEGFPNVVGESMACGVPCVATDVGDSARIIGETGFVVAPNNPSALAEGIRKGLTANRDILGELARARIVAEFSLDRLIKKTEEIICAKG